MCRHLSAIKGGRLAAACHPAKLVSLLISDVAGDDPINIASCHTVADPTTVADALDVIRRSGVDVPASVRHVLESGSGESVKPGDARLAAAEVRMIAPSADGARSRRRSRARGEGAPLIVGDAIEGEAREAGRIMAGIAQQVALHGQPIARPSVLLSGGETTVTVRGNGRGGRNVEFLLISAGMPFGTPGATNLLRIAQM